MTWREETAETPDPCRFADLLFQIVDQVRFRCFEGGPEIEEQGREQTEQERCGQDGSARPKIDHKGKVQRTERPGQGMEQEIIAPHANGESNRAADRGEEQTFAQQLAHDPPARSAKGDAERHFLRARSAASEQHVGRFRLAISRTAPAMHMSSVAIKVMGPSSSGPVLRLNRDGVWICNSRANSASVGCMALNRWLSTGRRDLAISSVSSGRRRAVRLNV